MTIDTNDIIRSIWPIDGIIQNYYFLESCKVQKPTLDHEYQLFNVISEETNMYIERLKIRSISDHDKKQFQ